MSRHAEPEVRAIPSEEPGDWKKALAEVDDAHVFYHPEFLEYLARHDGGRAELLAFGEPPNQVVLPWILRPLPPSLQPGPDGAELHDAIGPDYAGPVAGSGLSEIGPSFLRALREHCRSRGVISAFLRLNPFSRTPWEPAIERAPDPEKSIVWVDLSGGYDGAWGGFEHSARKNYKRALRSDLTLAVCDDDGEVESLATVYESTMKRRDAEERYRFDLPYFRELYRAVAGRTVTVTAKRGDRVAACHLYLVHGPLAFSYLGGADPDFLGDRPTNGVVTTAIRELASRGVERLILGGGVTSGDGIERFKRTFSPLTRPFRTLRWIADPDLYRLTCDRAGAPVTPEGFFPGYRAAPLASDS